MDFPSDFSDAYFDDEDDLGSADDFDLDFDEDYECLSDEEFEVIIDPADFEYEELDTEEGQLCFEDIDEFAEEEAP